MQSLIQSFSASAAELLRFLRTEVWTEPLTANAVLTWLTEQLQKGMSFTSLTFVLFFPVCGWLYYLIPKARVQSIWLLACSLGFYWFAAYNGGHPHPEAVVILLALALLTWVLGLAIGAAKNRAAKLALLWLGVLAHIGTLIYVKYTGFFAGLCNDLFGTALKGQESLSVVWMVGISFYTLMAIGYLADVCREKIAAEKNPIDCVLFISFFPAVVSGPVNRADQLLPQLHTDHHYDEKRVSEGARRMLWGYFKKLVISENAASIVALVFSTPGERNGFQLVLGSLLYTVQLYADFSGYSDLALGAAKCLGIGLPENFCRPYGARSIGEFWDRWHMSLSGWFQQYIYFPLGGSRAGLARTCVNLMVVFLVSGLWHGAGLTFLVWGLLHGLYSVISRLTRPLREKAVQAMKLDKVPLLHAVMQWFITFCMVSFAWIFFRADTVENAFIYISRLFCGLSDTAFNAAARAESLAVIGWADNHGYVLLCSILLMFGAEATESKRPVPETIGRIPFIFRLVLYYALLLAIMLFGVFNSTPFIYGTF